MKPWEKNWSVVEDTEDAPLPWEKNWAEPVKEEPGFFDNATRFVKEAVLGIKPEFKSVLEDAPTRPDTASTSRAPVRPEVRSKLNDEFDAATPELRQKAAQQKGWRGQLVRDRADGWEQSDAAVPTQSLRELDSRKEYQFLTPTQAEVAPKNARLKLEEVAAQSRSAMEYGKDFYNALGQGIVTVPKLAVDLVAPDSALASTLRAELASMRDQESETIQARDALMQMSIKEKDGFVDKYVETASQLLSNPSLGIRELVRQLPMMAGVVAASATGSGLAAGAVGLAGRFSPAVALSNALTGGGITAAASAAGTAAGGVGASMAMAGGDAAGSTYEHYMDDKAMPESLLQKSPDYQVLLQTMSPAEARREMAVTKSRMAALMAAPLGLLGYMGAEAAIVSRVVRGAPKKFGTKEAVGLAVKDNIGEQLEEGGTQMSSNYAIRDVDESRSLMEGVPQAMATAAVTSAPMSVGAAAMNMAGQARAEPRPETNPLDAGEMARGILGTARAQGEAQTQQALADLGAAPDVDSAIAAAGEAVRAKPRAVSLDDSAILAQATEAAGITEAEMRMQSQGVDAAIAAADQAVAQANSAGPAELGQAPVAPETVTWTGRRGDGYATPEDAQRALTERTKTRPMFEWTAQQNADGRFVLQGVKRAGPGGTAIANVQPSLEDAKGTTNLQNASTTAIGASNVPVRQQPSSTSIWAKSDDGGVDQQLEQAVEELAVASGTPRSIRLVSRAESLRELDVRAQFDARQLSSEAAAPDANTILTDIENAGEAAATAFGWRPTLVTGMPDAFGVQYKGRTYLDIGVLVGRDKRGNPVQTLAIQTIGHETTHNLEKSQDPQDRADYARLREVVLANAKPEALAHRISFEDKGQTYGENEVVADVSGNFWLEPKFWQRLYELDNGSTMRRIAYKFMKNATKLLDAVKGSRMNNATWINNITEVREVAAQVWASKAQRGDSLFGSGSTHPSHSSSHIKDNGRSTQSTGAKDGQQGSRQQALAQSEGLPADRGGDQPVPQRLGGAAQADSNDRPNTNGSNSTKQGGKRAAEREGLARDGGVAQPVFDSAKDTPSRSTGRSNFEVAPDPNDTALSGQWNGLPLARKIEISREVAQIIVPQVLALSDAAGSVIDQTGSYLGDTNPSFALQLTQGDLTEVSKQLGYVLSQDSMMNLSIKPFPGSSPVGAVVVDVQALDFDGVKTLYDELRAAIPQVGGQSTSNGVMTILNYSDLSTQELTNKVDAVVAGRYAVHADEVHYSFPEKKDYDYDKQANDTRTAGQMGEVNRQRLGDLRGEASAAINRAIDKPSRSNVKAEQGASAVAGVGQLPAKREGFQRVPGGLDSGKENVANQSNSDVGGERKPGGDGSRIEQRLAGKRGGLAALPGYAHGQIVGAAGPDASLVSVAEKYAKDNGIALRRQKSYVAIDEARAKRIADAYAQMEHAPQDPKVREAFSNLIEQTTAQYRALEVAGYRFWLMDPENDPYDGNPWNAMRDLRQTKSMAVFPTDAGFGSADTALDTSDNPLNALTDVRWPSGSLGGPLVQVRANDLFRAVHDAFGHGLEGAGFRPQVLDYAWQAHARLFTGSAIGAITSETRGQNSWLNFGPHSASNRTAGVFDTVFADQKTGLMPEWTWTEGRVGDALPLDQSTNKGDKNEQESVSAAGATTTGQAAKTGGLPDGQGRPNAVSRSRAGVDDGVNNAERLPPSYGKPIAGATSAVGVHFSKQARQSLNGSFYGTGMKGAEARRLEGQDDIRPRVFFYVDAGNGIRPEAAVGGFAHHVQLNNLYDVTQDALGLVRDTRGMEGDKYNNWERAILKAGFDGWTLRNPGDAQHFAVLVGKQHTAVPVATTNPQRSNGKASQGPTKAAEQTRSVGNELVRRPQGAEVMQVIAAMRAGIKQVAPSFKMEFGEARVLESESAVADAVLADHPGGFAFGEGISRSDAFAEFDDIADDAFANMEIDDDVLTDDDLLADLDVDMDSLADILRAELAKDQAQAEVSSAQSMPTPKAIKDAGIRAEDAFDMTGALDVMRDGSAEFWVPDYAASVIRSVVVRGTSGELMVSVSARPAATFINKTGLTDAQVEKYAARQVAGAVLTAQGHDIASAYRKGTILKIAAGWRQVSQATGAFKLPAATTTSTDFNAVAQEMGAFKSYNVSADLSDGSGLVVFARKSDGRQFHASVSYDSSEMETCTMGLANSGGLGTEYYAVLGRVAENMGVQFKADSMLSGVNAYRRTEQALSYALKSGRTDVLLPGPQNRVYGFEEDASTPEAHDRNIARLALAGLRNVEELMPDVRRLKYEPETDRFVDSKGNDAEATVKKTLADPQARIFGLGRSTIARAVITGQIIAGEKLQPKAFKSAVAYSLANAEMDAPVSEVWGEPGDLNPNLKRFIAGSTIVEKDGTPKMMFHGTAQDVRAFRPKQAGAVFLTDNTNFAEDFSESSANWMLEHWQQILTPAQQKQAKAEAVKAVMADKYTKMSERKEQKQSILEGDPTGVAADALNDAVAQFMPSGPNIMPVFARVTMPFDYSNKSDVDSVVFTLWDRAGVDDGDTLEITAVSEGGYKDFYSQRKLHGLISDGVWDIIESPEVQDVIRTALGHDGFWVKENGQRNLAVYDPKMVKSVFNTTYDTSTDDISRSRSNLDAYMGKRNKTMATVSSNSEQEADMALAVQSIEAVQKEIEAGNKEVLPVPLGRVPHVLGMLGAPNKMLRVDTSILKKVLFDKHADDFADVSPEEFIRSIYNPAMVLKGRSANEFDLVTTLTTKAGPIMVPVTMGTGKDSSAAIMSAYAKNVNGKGDSILNRIKAGNVLYADAAMAQVALTGRDDGSIRGINVLGAQFPRTPPRLTQSNSSTPIQGIITSGAQFPSAPPRRTQTSSVNQDDLSVKPRNPNYVGWAQVREIVLGGIAQKKIKTDVDLMRRIGDLYKGDVADAPSFSRAGDTYTLADETTWQTNRRKFQDYFLRVREVQRAVMEQGGTVTEQTDTYSAEILSHGRKNALLEDFARDTVAPMMDKLVRLGIEMPELSLYAYAKHAEERNQRIAKIDRRMPDGGSGMTTADANAILASVAASGKQAQYDDLHGDLMAIVQTNRMVMLDEGLITQDEFNALDGMYQHYIPLRGFELVDEDNKPTGRSAGQGFNIRGAETVRALGRKSRAGQLMENALADYQRTTVRAEHNHVAKVFLNFVLQNPDAKLWEVDAKTTKKAMDRQTGRVARNTVIEKGEDTIAVKIKGREIYIQIKDPLLARAMRKSHTDETGEMTRDLMRSVGLYTTLLRNTLTRYNPEFAVVNAARDMGFGAAAMLDTLGEKGVAKFTAHYAGAMAVSARNERNKLDPATREWDRWFTEFRAAGGITGGFYQQGLEEITGDIRGMMIEAGSPTTHWTEKARFNAVTRAAKGALRVLEFAGSVSENAARVAAFRTAREMGKTPAQAAVIAKQLTTNFDRKGEYGQILNSLYVFFNAAVQGTHRTLQMFKNPKVLGYMGAVTAGTVGLALANALAGGDDPDDGMAYWDKIPDYVKERNIIIMLPPGSQIEGAETVGTKGRYMMIPVQYGLNLFPVIGYTVADFMRNTQDKSRGITGPQAGIRLGSAFMGSFNPFGGAVDITSGSSMAQEVMPSIFDPVVQFTTGTNAFGRDSAPFKSPFDSKPDSQNSNVRQAGGPAERVAQWMNAATGGSEYESGGIDVSAGTLENLVRSLTGGTGIFLYDTLALADKALESSTGGDPDLFIRDIPIARRIYGETAGDIDQGLFYERRKQIQEARSVEKGANEAGVEITDPKKLALASMNTDAGRYTKWLAEIRREMKEVQSDTEMTKGDRKLKLRELRAERDRLTADFNLMFNEVIREELNAE